MRGPNDEPHQRSADRLDPGRSRAGAGPQLTGSIATTELVLEINFTPFR